MTRPSGTDRLRVGVHVGQLLQPVPGGIGRVTEMLCAELPKHADVVAFSSCPRHSRRALDARLDHAVEFRSLGPESPRWRYELWCRYRGRRIDLDVDVCHAPSLAVPPSAAPLVVSINDVAFLRHPETFTSHGVRFHERGLEITRREAAAVIVPSAFTRDELVREGFDASRIFCVPLAVDLPDQLPTHDVCARLRRHGVQTPYVLTVGTLEPRKGHARLVRAFERVRARHPDLTLVFAGASGWMARDELRELERPGVVVLGRVSDAELDLLYRQAELVVSASIYEGFGLTVLEALARGCVVLASEIPAHVEVAGASARFFAPNDDSALVAELDDLVRDDVARTELRRGARSRAEQFSVAGTIDGYLTAYTFAATHR